MSEVVQQTSATIHTFPPRGRFAIRRDGDLMSATDSNQWRVANGIVTGAWYHEQAIQDAARDDGAPKRQ